MRVRNLLAPIAVCVVAAACLNDSTGSSDTRAGCRGSSTAPVVTGDTVTTPSGLKYINKVVGTGATAELNRGVAVRYVGRLCSGAVFDSVPLDTVLKFTPGVSNIIPGFAEGVVGMKVGGERRLIIPPSLGYGTQGSGPIPPNATIIFDVTLKRVQ
jgi:peptidylprolyl isomerase